MSLVGELVAFGLVRFGILVLITTLGWFVAFWIRKWFSQKCRWSHKPKYLKLGYWTNYKCSDHFERHTSDEPLWATVATWVCQEPGCNAHGEKCFGCEAWWKIEHGQVVIDEKKMTDPGKYQTPKEAVEKEKRDRGGETPIGEKLLEQMKTMEARVLSELKDRDR